MSNKVLTLNVTEMKPKVRRRKLHHGRDALVSDGALRRRTHGSIHDARRGMFLVVAAVFRVRAT